MFALCSSQHRGLAELGVAVHLSWWGLVAPGCALLIVEVLCNSMVVCPCRCGLPYLRVAFFSSSSSGITQYWAVHIVMGGPASGLCPFHCCVPAKLRSRLVWFATPLTHVSGGYGRIMGENEPGRKSWPVFVTHCLGPPLCSSFPITYPSIEVEGHGPHSSGEGRGTCGLKSVVWRELG